MTRLTAALADRYRIERELGAGGMATVYLAYDIRHDRRVAVKVLRPELAAVIGAERFLAEIKTTANLQHPHILPLFDSGAADSFLFYVMPFIDGESLRDRLTRDKQLPIPDAVRIATEVAGALDYAHRHGVIHRDIKPENVLLHDDRALVADFGIALAASNAGGTRMTETGMSLGTPAYMSPEQAMGERDITARSDVYALGCVLYEMLTGDPPFTGSTAQAIVARVLTEAPRAITPQRHTIPPHVEAAVLTALEKLPADRFASAAEFATALATPSFVGTGRMPRASARADPCRRVSVALGLLTVLLAATVVWALRRGGGGPVIYDVGLSDSAALALGADQTEFAVSPRADFIVYTAQRGDTATELWYRSLVDLSSRAISGTQGAHIPRISPDGRRLAFFQGSSVKVVPIEGGLPRVLTDVRDMATLQWASPSRLFVMDDDGRTVRWLDADAGQTSEARVSYCIEAQWLADRQRLLCGGGGIKEARVLDPATNTLVALQAPSEGRTANATVPVAGSAFHIVEGRYLVYLSLDGDVRAATFDLASGRVGRSTTLVPGVRREAYTGAGQFALTPGGTLVYVPGPNAEIGRLVEAGPGYAPHPLATEPASYLRYDLSPDERRLAAAVQATGRQELRVYDLRDGQRQVWLTALNVGQPLWSPSGDHVMVDVSDSLGGAILVGVPGSATPPDTILVQRNSLDYVEPMDYHSEHLVIGVVWGRSLVVRFDPTLRPIYLDTLIQDGNFPTLSPDGRNIAYGRVSTGENFVSPYPSLDRRVQLAADAGAGESVWLSNTDVLIRSNTTWFRSRITPGTDEVVGASLRWFGDPRFVDTPGWSQRATRGGHLLYVQGPEQTRAAYLRVVPHWVATMERAAREANR